MAQDDLALVAGAAQALRDNPDLMRVKVTQVAKDEPKPKQPKKKSYSASNPKGSAPPVPKIKTTKKPGSNTAFTGVTGGTKPKSGITREDIAALLTSSHSNLSTIGTTGQTLGGLQTLRSLALTGSFDPSMATGRDQVSVNAALAEFFKADADVIRKWQTDLADAGFFGINSKGEIQHDYAVGTPDDKTVKAFSDFLEYAIYRGGFQGDIGDFQQSTGQTWMELLDDRKRAVAEESIALAAANGGGGGGGSPVQMPDPVQVKALANHVSQLLQGKQLDPAQLDQILATVNSGVISADASNTDYDVTSHIAEWLRTAEPTETSAHDLANIYSTFTSLIGPMGQAAARGGTMGGVTRT